MIMQAKNLFSSVISICSMPKGVLGKGALI